MRKLLVATAALAALVGTPAFAADMAAPVYKAPPPAAPMFSWTGFYIGLNGGYGWGHDPVTFSAANAAAVPYFVGGAVPGGVTTNPARRAVRRPDRLQLSMVEFRRRRRNRLRLGRYQGYRCGWHSCAQLRSVHDHRPTEADIARHLPRPRRCRGGSRTVLRHRRLGLWPHPAQHLGHHADHRLRPGGSLRRRVVDAMADRLDRWRRYRIRLCCGMERQDRISALRSRHPQSGTIRSCRLGADPGIQLVGDVPRQYRPRRHQLPLRRLSRIRRRYFGNGAPANAGALSFWF